VHRGKLLLGHASELARLRTEEQEAALKWLLRQSKDVPAPDAWKKAHVIPVVPEFRLWIQQNLFSICKTPRSIPQIRTRIRPWELAQTVSSAVAVSPPSFGDTRKGDVCTAAPCWLAKRSATIVNMAAAKERTGAVPLARCFTGIPLR
jgi:hypothetical protein